jgi:GntR family transcriptional regulator of vanillate catabolism
MLLRGEFRPGERLAELTLAPLLKASRTPVRLALDRLAHEGLLVALPKGGFKVREFTIADIWDAIEVRGVLEGTAARLAAERLSSPDELAELRRCCWAAGDSIPTDAEEFTRYLEMNGAFHHEVWRLAKSPVLMRALETVGALPFAGPNALVFGPAEYSESPYAGTVAAEHHRSIVEAIENHEGARAESLAREHSRVSRRNLARALEDKELSGRVPGFSLLCQR